MIDWRGNKLKAKVKRRKTAKEAKNHNRGSREGKRKKRQRKQPTLIRRRRSERQNE